MNYDDISSDEFIDDVELIENRTKKVRTSRPPRSVLYYLKAYESWLSLTPIQLPPRTRIIQVNQLYLFEWLMYLSKCRVFDPSYNLSAFACFIFFNFLNSSRSLSALHTLLYYPPNTWYTHGEMVNICCFNMF